MSTKFYLPSSGTPPLPSEPFHGGWEDTTGAVRLPMFIDKTNTALTDFTFQFPNTNTGEKLIVQYQSDVVASQTLIGNNPTQIIIRCQETTSNGDAHLVGSIWHRASNGTVTLLAEQMGTTTEFDTTASSRVTSMTWQQFFWTFNPGDRLLFEVGVHGETPAIENITIRLGDPTATNDFSTTPGDANDLTPYLYFPSDNLTSFGPSVDLKQAAAYILANDATDPNQTELTTNLNSVFSTAVRGTIYQHRAMTEGLSSTLSNVVRRLEYRTKGHGAWQAVSSTGAIQLVDSTFITDGTSNTSPKYTESSPYVYTAGQLKDTTNDTTAIASFTSTTYTEDIWAFKFDTSAIHGQAYEFRVTSSGVQYANYSSTVSLVEPDYNMVQGHFRFYNDDGDPNTASTAKASEDTGVTGIPTETNFILRAQLEEQGLTDGYQTSNDMQWRRQGTTTWTTMANTGEVKFKTSTFVTDFASATARLTTPTGLTFQSTGSSQKESPGFSSDIVTYGGKSYTESVWSLAFDSTTAPAGQTYEFKIAGAVSVTVMPTARVAGGTSEDQAGFRIFEDDVSLNGATARETQGVSTGLEIGKAIRVRFGITATGQSYNPTRRLEWRRDAGSWSTISTTGEIKMFDSTFFSDGTATTQRLTGLGTFVAGQGKDTSATTTSVTINDGYYVEDEWCVVLDSTAVEGSVYQLRLTNSGTAFDSYPAIPSVKVPTWTSYGSRFLYTAANWGAVTFYLEVYMRATAGRVFARLYNETDSTIVTNSILSTSSTSHVRLRSSALTLTDGKVYRIQFGKGLDDAGKYIGGRIIAVE